jgi:hypothetical protein
VESPWIPAFAGMTSNSNGNGSGGSKIKMDSSFRWNDGDVVHRCRSARMLRAWIPAFAGMTVKWFTAVGVPDVVGLGPGFRRDDDEGRHDA